MLPLAFVPRSVAQSWGVVLALTGHNFPRWGVGKPTACRTGRINIRYERPVIIGEGGKGGRKGSTASQGAEAPGNLPPPLSKGRDAYCARWEGWLCRPERLAGTAVLPVPVAFAVHSVDNRE